MKKLVLLLVLLLCGMTVFAQRTKKKATVKYSAYNKQMATRILGDKIEVPKICIMPPMKVISLSEAFSMSPEDFRHYSEWYCWSNAGKIKIPMCEDYSLLGIIAAR
jgi:hypothetical protein